MFWFILGILAFIFAIVAFICGATTNWGMSIVAGVVALILAIVLIVVSCVSSVPTGHTGILTTFGAVQDVSLPNGVNFHAPWQNVITMSNKEQTFTETNSAFSKDLQEVEYTYTVKYSLSPDAAPQIYKTVGTDYFNILIKPQVNNAVKAQFGICKAEEMTETRNAIQTVINDTVIPYAESYGITVQIFLDNFDFTDAYTDAVEAKQVAEQDALRDKTQQNMLTEQTRAEAERERIKAENAAEIARINAEADLEVQKINADAAEYAGQKESAVNKALADSITAELIQYQFAIRWNGELPQVMMSESSIPVVNLDNIE